MCQACSIPWWFQLVCGNKLNYIIWDVWGVLPVWCIFMVVVFIFYKNLYVFSVKWNGWSTLFIYKGITRVWSWPQLQKSALSEGKENFMHKMLRSCFLIYLSQRTFAEIICLVKRIYLGERNLISRYELVNIGWLLDSRCLAIRGTSVTLGLPEHSCAVVQRGGWLQCLLTPVTCSLLLDLF